MYRLISKVAVILLLGLAAATQAIAQDTIDDPFYFGVGLVHSSLAVNKSNVSANYASGDSVSVSNEPASFDFLFGYKRDRFLSIEFGYTELGPVNATNGITTRKLFNTSSLFVDASLAREITQNASVFAILGVSLWDAGASGAHSIESGSGLLYGAGFDLNLYGGADQQLRIEWRHHDFDGVLLERADTLSMLIMFYF